MFRVEEGGGTVVGDASSSSGIEENENRKEILSSHKSCSCVQMV